ncbi:MAG: hypothetical protein ACLPOO_08180 [Terriglobales bacterium]
MKRITLTLALVLLIATAAAAQISPQFFAMHASTAYPWPTAAGVSFSSWRSVSSRVKWSDINTAPGVYDWTKLDRWLANTQEYGQSMLYTVYYTPTWASQCPTCTCNAGNTALGGCYPPVDVNSDGSGTDQDLKDFVKALMQHVGPGKIQYLEIWNEPNIPIEWGGTMQELVRMTQDVRAVAKSLDPNVQIISPPETGDGQRSLKMTWLTGYLAAGGGQYVDIIGLHGYVYYPEDIITRLNATTAAMAQYGQSHKPIFVTEGSWCCEHTPIAALQQPGFSFRQYLSLLSTPAQRFYLFNFDNVNEGNLWSATTGSMTTNGLAYKLFYNWLVGATMTEPCQDQAGNNSVWSCTFTKSQGYQAEAIWSTTTPLGSSITVSVPPQYVQYRDLYGHLYPIENRQVQVGYAPIWLENGL